jgi:serine/threonine-protein kinase MRCK
MQIALEKEFQAKEQLIDEINNLKAELDAKQHKISDLHVQIEQINTDMLKSQMEIKELREDLFAHQKALATAGLSTTGTNHSHIIASTSTSTFSYSNETNVNHLNSLHLATSSSADMKSTSAEYNNHNNAHQLIKQQLHSDSASTNTSGPLLTINTHNANHMLNTGELTNELNYADLSSLSVNNPSMSSTSNVVKNGVNTNNKSSSTNIVNSNQTANNNVSQITNGHKFEVVSFQTIERCEYCCGILYGICRQAVRCKGKNCNYLCHPKCRQYLPANCPININQRVQLKGVDFTRGIGTLMQGNLKVPKIGGVKKGWQDHYVFLSNARLYVCPIVDNKPSLIPSQIIDIRDPQFSVSSVNESDVIHASKRDIPCILKMIVSKLKTPAVRQKLLFCAKDEKEKHNWINVLKDLNERLIQASKQSSNSSSILLPIEAKEICEASSIRNAYSACIYDSERLLIASDEGIDVIDIKTDCRIQRFHDKKSFLIDVFREEKLIVAISGKNHQIFLFPTIIIEGMNAEPIKIEETKGCNLFCLGKLVKTSSTSDLALQHQQQNSIYSSATRLLCVAIKKVVSIYEINSTLKPKYKKLREIELTMNVQSMQIINNQLCIGFQSEFALYSLSQETAPIA